MKVIPIIDVEKITQMRTAQTPAGAVVARPGDLLVIFDNGQIAVLSSSWHLADKVFDVPEAPIEPVEPPEETMRKAAGSLPYVTPGPIGDADLGKGTATMGADDGKPSAADLDTAADEGMIERLSDASEHS